MSLRQISKFHDIIIFGSSEKVVALPITYHIEIKQFLDNYKKEDSKKGILSTAIQTHLFLPFTS